MGVFEINEVLALVFVAFAFGATLQARLHPGNTPRTREWWSRFLITLSFILVAQIATNAEQLWSEDSPLNAGLNTVEHVLMAGAGLSATTLAWRALVEARERASEEEAQEK